MLTIQPGMVNNLNRGPAFGRGELQRYAEDVDFEEINDYPYQNSYNSFDYDKEIKDAKDEMDLWEGTRANLESIAESAKSVPVVNKGLNIFDKAIKIAIGWCGLRWGAAGTLKALSEAASSQAGKAVAKRAGNVGTFIAEKFTALKELSLYKSSAKKVNNLKHSFFDTRFGKAITKAKNAVTDNSIFHKSIELKNKTVSFFKNINYKRVTVEGMGVAGGGTAAVNVFGGKPVDGARQNVEVDTEGNYYINGRKVQQNEGENHYAA